MGSKEYIALNEQRLLERIRSIENKTDSHDSMDTSQVIASVVGYLRHILNTRQGNAQIAPDFGVPDFTNMIGASGLDGIQSIQDAITAVIIKYEPRLASVHVEFAPEEVSPLSMQFKLYAKLRINRIDNREIPVVFETVLDPNGRIKVING